MTFLAMVLIDPTYHHAFAFGYVIGFFVGAATLLGVLFILRFCSSCKKGG